MDDKDNGRSAIGGTSELGGQQAGNITYGVMPEQIASKLTDNPGTDFLVIQRVRQGEEPKVWSTGDPEQTSHLFNQVGQYFSNSAGANRKEPVTI